MSSLELSRVTRPANNLPKECDTWAQTHEVLLYTHAIMFPYRFFMRFSSFLAESHGADCPSKKL